MGDKERGLYDKFTVQRRDGRDRFGQKHAGCKYFVLDMDHDKHALPALKAYAKSCEKEYPFLANDLTARIKLIEGVK